MRQLLTGIGSMLAFAATLPGPVAAEEEAEAGVLRDKTLVVWATAASLEQRGGGVLTVERPGGVFDAIVFGEIEPRRWMAGSNFYSRSLQAQSQIAEETATPDALVQIAVVYEGAQVRVFRDGALYSEHAVERPEAFGDDTVVLIGLRHLDASPDTGYFAGSVEDARVYATALGAEAIAGLRPNQPSSPEPVAWWHFDEGRATDVTGRFPVTTLYGAARIEGGRLRLDGRGAHLLAGRSGRPHGTPAETARALRERILVDPHRPSYHFVIPEGRGMPFDPNGAIYWKGRYHLFYIFQDTRTGQNDHHWGHVSSDDLFHWRHHPTGLVSGMFSGNCFVNKDGRPTMCYHQVGKGNSMAVALDDDLNTWRKLSDAPITPETQEGDPHHGLYSSWDPYGWLEGDAYYAIFGGKRPGVAKAPALEGPWTYVGDLFAHGVDGVALDEDVSCPDLFRLGGKDVLLCISHRLGCRYYVGEWRGERFHPERHAQMSWVDNSFFAPESLVDGRGRRIMWAWIFDSPAFGVREDYGWSGTMSLPRVLTLGDDGALRMDVPEEIESLRRDPVHAGPFTAAAGEDRIVESVHGNSIELAVEADVSGLSRFSIKVLASPDGREDTTVFYDATAGVLGIDTRRSGLEGSPQTVEAGPFALRDGERLNLRVFVDRSVVEAFANGRQAVMRRAYPTLPNSLCVHVAAEGGPAQVTRFDAWTIAAANPY